MGKKNSSSRSKKRNKPKMAGGEKVSTATSNFVSDAGPGCYIARRDVSPPWMIEWEDIDPDEFEGESVPDIAIDTEERTLSLCNVDKSTKVAYITVFDTRVLSSTGTELPQGSTTDNSGHTFPCVTFIVLCPPTVFAHLCYLEDCNDITQVRIESDVQEWRQHPHPNDEHPHRLGFPLAGGPFLCTQGEGGELTHFFSGNLHAIDFRCPVGTDLLAVADGIITDANDHNTLTGISVTNLFQWNSILMVVDDDKGETSSCQLATAKDNTTKSNSGPIFVEYVHIQKSIVKAGDRVKQGQVIGSSGSVGFSPEPHLHFCAFRSSNPEAPTVRVRFLSTESGQAFLPKAGILYDKNGATS